MTSSKKKTRLIIASVVSLVVIVAIAFAWFTATDEVTNRFRTADTPDGNVEIVEVFDPPDDWKPGQKIIKQIGVVNLGEAPVLVRLTFEEMLKLIRPYTASGSAYNPASSAVPKLTNPTAYSSWFTLTGTPNAAINNLYIDSLPAGLQVKATAVTSGAGTPAEKTAYSFAIFGSPIASGDYAGRNQKVTADFAVATDGSGKVTVSNIQYYASTGKDSYAAVWATVRPTVANINTSRAEAAAALAQPTWYGNYIELNYTSASIDNTTPTSGKWYYNPADGYFYYIGLLNPGMISPNLLESLTLNSLAGNTYANLEFDLVVKMNAIQNTADALSGAWGISSGPLYNALSALCE